MDLWASNILPKNLNIIYIKKGAIYLNLLIKKCEAKNIKNRSADKKNKTRIKEKIALQNNEEIKTKAKGNLIKEEFKK